MLKKKNASKRSFVFSVFQHLAMTTRKRIRKRGWGTCMIRAPDMRR